MAIGGMAEVFLAAESGEHSLDRLVIIKRILPHLAAEESFIDMFLREARVAARIAHPNVVQIYELGESGGFPYIAMEYVDGSTLKELLSAASRNEVRLPTEVVLDLMMQGLDGAHAAHELKDSRGQASGLVHRDLSPHNLMVTSTGHVKLLDFGIAKATESMKENTRTGVLKGKISYMSPEQCRQDGLDRRSDVFAMGIVAWELFAGHKLFQNMSELATMQAIVRGNIKSLAEERPDLPPEVVQAVHRAMAVDIDARYPTAEAFRRSLYEAADAAGIKVDRDRTALLVKTLLGEVHERRRKHVDAALERTLVTLSAVRLPTESASHLSPVPEGTSFTSTTRVARTAGMVGAAGVLFGGGTVAVAIVAFVAAIGIFWYTTQERAEPGPVQPDIATDHVRPTGEAVEFAIASATGEDAVKAEYEPLRIYLEKELQVPVDLFLDPSYQAVQDRLLDRKADFASLPPNTYVDATRKQPGIQLLAVRQFDGSTGSDGYLLVSESNPATSIHELQGSTVCYVNRLSTTGWVLPRAYLIRNKFDPDTDFKTHISGSHFQVMRDLIAGLCEVGAIYSGAYLTADKEHDVNVARLRMLVITGRTPHDAVVAGPEANEAVKRAFRQALLDFDPEKVIGQARLGKIERVTGFVEADDNTFAGFLEARKLVGLD